jgi:ferredoxin-thioredoxin reductase catalytic subunit
MCHRVEQEVAELKGPVEQEAAAAAAAAAADIEATPAAASSAALDRASSLGYGELPAAAPSEQELQRRQTLCDLQDDIEEVRAACCTLLLLWQSCLVEASVVSADTV